MDFAPFFLISNLIITGQKRTKTNRFRTAKLYSGISVLPARKHFNYTHTGAVRNKGDAQYGKAANTCIKTRGQQDLSENSLPAPMDGRGFQPIENILQDESRSVKGLTGGNLEKMHDIFPTFLS